jgi:hypothetical protein
LPSSSICSIRSDTWKRKNKENNVFGSNVPKRRERENKLHVLQLLLRKLRSSVSGIAIYWPEEEQSLLFWSENRISVRVISWNSNPTHQPNVQHRANCPAPLLHVDLDSPDHRTAANLTLIDKEVNDTKRLMSVMLKTFCWPRLRAQTNAPHGRWCAFQWRNNKRVSLEIITVILIM